MILLTMIFLHIVDDYYLQGILAQMKQKKFWKENAPDEYYQFDYIWALFMHGFSWTFMIMLPFAVSGSTGPFFYILFVVNTLLHAGIDNLKANRFMLNLWEDQILHMVQIIATCFILGGF